MIKVERKYRYLSSSNVFYFDKENDTLGTPLERSLLSDFKNCESAGYHEFSSERKERMVLDSL